MEMDKIQESAKILYNYLNVDCDVKKSDIILGMGCMDDGIPKICTDLYNAGYGDTIIFSGNVGKGTDGILNVTEAERFRDIAINRGISEDNILLETNATNTYENYKFTKNLLEGNSYNYNSIIIVHKPYVKRRCLAIAEIEFPDKIYYVTSEKLSYEDFLNKSINNKTMDVDEIINELVGEISNILEASKYNLLSNKELGDDVLEAYKYLINVGYSKYLITEEKIQYVMNRWSQLGLIKK